MRGRHETEPMSGESVPEHGLDDRSDGRDETPNERADRNWNELLQELRVMQTGTQILTGFLLAVAFQPRFTDMDRVRAFYADKSGLRPALRTEPRLRDEDPVSD